MDFGLPQHILTGASASAHLRQLVTPIDDRASSIWSFQRIQGRSLSRLPQIPHQIPISQEYPPPYERHGRVSVAAEYIVEELIQLTFESEVEIITNSH